jgi:hypothetical protein
MNRPNWHYGPQRTPEWDDLRRGKVTGTGIPFVLAHGLNGEESKTREAYLVKLATELDTGVTIKDTFETEDMRNGIERQPAMTALYEQTTGEVVDDGVSFIDHPRIERFGVSPDGIIMSTNLRDFPTVGLEGKCPKLTTFIRRVLSGVVERAHLWQCYALMECAALEAVDYVNYSPERPVGQQLLVRRVYRDEKEIKRMVEAVVLFNEEVDERRHALARAVYFQRGT